MLSDIYDFISNIPRIHDNLYYDEVWHRIMVNRSLFNLDGIRPMDDHIITEFRYLCESSTQKECSHEDTRRAMVMFALHNRRNPFLERISSIQWDYTSRLDTFLKDMGCTTTLPSDDSNDYLGFVSRAIFLSAIQRQIEKGAKVDFVPVIIGDQGSGKSTLCERISLGWYATNPISAEDEKGFYEKSSGSIICELQEGTQFDGSSDDFKTLIDQTHYQFGIDGYIEKITIRNILIATTNRELFLKDLTGNRRFYPITLLRDNSHVFDMTDEHVEQVWAEALFRYSNGERWNDGKRDIDILSSRLQKERIVGYYGREEIREILSTYAHNYGDSITYTDIRHYLSNDYGFTPDDADKAIRTLSRNLSDMSFSRSSTPVKSKIYPKLSRGIYREYPL